LLISGIVVACLLGYGKSVCVASSVDEQLFGGTSDDIAAQIIQTSDKGYAILGTTYSFGAGCADFWFIKLDQNKNPQWNLTYGGTQKETAKTVVQTSDDGYVIAGTTASFGLCNSSFWLVKVDSSGNFEWNQTYGTATSELDCMIQTNDKGYVMVGRVTKNSSSYVWLVKTDVNGNMLWNQTFSQGVSHAVVESSDGGYLFAGTLTLPNKDYTSDAWLIKTDPYGNMQLNQTYDLCELFDYATNLVQNSDGTYTFAGMTGAFYSHDLWVVNVNSTGSMVWNTFFDTKEAAYCTSLTQTTDQGYAAAATTDSFDIPDSSRYIILVKLDKNGNTQWNQTHNSFAYYQNVFVTQTNNQTYAIAATTKTEENTDYNILFFTTQNTGEPIPEFPTWTTLAIMLLAIPIAGTFYKTKLNNSGRELK